MLSGVEEHRILEPPIHGQDLSKFGEEVGNVWNQRNIFNGCTQNQCTDMEVVFNFVDEIRQKEHSEEILNVECLEYASPSWTRSILADDQAVKWAKAKVCVYADSVLCIGQGERYFKSNR